MTCALYTKKPWSTPEPVTPKSPGVNYEYYWLDIPDACEVTIGR